MIGRCRTRDNLKAMDVQSLVADYLASLSQETDEEILARFEQARVDSQDEAE